MGSDFRLPGPTPLPPRVLAAMQGEMLPHRGGRFQQMYASILERTKSLHGTAGDAFLWPASGSAGWELAIVNLLSPGDPVLCVVTGNFGDRFAQVGKAFGLDTRRLDTAWGDAATPDLLRDALAAHPDVKAVFITHNETSTGVTNPLRELAAVVQDHGALVVVDAVSSVGGIPLHMDEWGVDFAISGSQKAWMCPPGLVIAAMGPRAWRAHGRSSFPRFFWDLSAAKKAAADGSTPTTAPLTLLYAFDAALTMILEEGIEQVWQRHHLLGDLTRTGMKALGLRLFANEAFASDTVTAFWPPDGCAVSDLIARLSDDHGITVASGQGPFADKIVRVGHMGWVNGEDMERLVDGLGSVISTLDANEPVGAVR